MLPDQILNSLQIYLSYIFLNPDLTFLTASSVRDWTHFGEDIGLKAGITGDIEETYSRTRKEKEEK